MKFNFFKYLFFSFTLITLTPVNSLAETTRVEFKTNIGAFTVELYPDKAPITVANFLQYVKDGFYEKTIFHRVINNFMIQGGGFERDLFEKPTKEPIKNESNNGLKNKVGTIAMARTPDPDSATSQFFINLKDNDFLDYTSPEPDKIGYCVFGKVTKGMDVVKQIGVSPTGSISRFSDVPIKPIKIISTTVINSETTE
ncbi:MAG TPA: peptidylprolyl isomerase [Methylophilaceae bacterium]|nr:peptidylprolyl isomerase [Methylophilaceae bacterium]